MPYNGEKVIKMSRYNQGYLATINAMIDRDFTNVLAVEDVTDK